MNYVCVVYSVIVLIIAVDWLARARRSFRGQAVRHEEVAQSGSHTLRSPLVAHGNIVELSAATLLSESSH